jgi:hypothetical protein
MIAVTLPYCLPSLQPDSNVFRGRETRISVGDPLTLRKEGLDVVLDDLLDVLFHVFSDGAFGDLLEKSSLRGGKVSTELALPADDLIDWYGIKETVDTRVDDGNLDFDGEGRILTLL